VGKGGQGCAYAIVDARNVVHVLPSAVATALYADPLGALLVLNQELRARWAVAALLPDRNLRVTGWHLFLFLLTHSGDDARPMLTSHFALLWSGDTMRMRGLLKLCSAPRALESGGNEKLWGWSGAAGWCTPQALPLAAAAPFLPPAARLPKRTHRGCRGRRRTNPNEPTLIHLFHQENWKDSQGRLARPSDLPTVSP
jgi:hypothetical protein